MPGLVPGIHDLVPGGRKDVDGQDKPGHDEISYEPPSPLHPKDRETQDQQDQEDHDKDVEQKAGDIR
jgi:hypothetical protein